MSTVSLIESDQSDRLAKRFANLASSYFEHPEEARTSAATVPLENLFRILQMYRYDAFSDEPRSGILELEGFGDRVSHAFNDETWYNKIKEALGRAFEEVFNGVSKSDAVDEIQGTLSWLATDQNAPSADSQTRTRRFLQRFVAALD